MRAIDADAMLARLEEWNTSDSTDRALYNFTLHRILEQPTIEPERKKGKWLPDNNSLYEMRFVCSECKTSEVVPTIGFTKYEPIWDFCPNCGAKMEVEHEDR